MQGTLTQGKPAVTDVIACDDITETEVIFPEWDLVSDILLNTVRQAHIITLEDPVELLLRPHQGVDVFDRRDRGVLNGCGPAGRYNKTSSLS